MKAYAPYVDRLQELASSKRNKQTQARVTAALDGEASRELRSRLQIEELRKEGAFFTSVSLSRFAVSPLAKSLTNRSRIYDPACGAGDLLLACSGLLPLRRSLAETLGAWSRSLAGTDIHPEFVRAAKTRLQLAAWQRHAFTGRRVTLAAGRWFNQLSTDCSLTCLEAYRNATHVVLNPPYTMVDAPRACEWTSGIVNSAAIFLERALTCTAEGTRIVAILPEVLRCGARYEKFRAVVESHARLKRLRSFGLFSNLADVDVFVLDIVKRESKPRRQSAWQWGQPGKSEATLQDYFSVAVGTVVDFRDPKNVGESYPYLTVDDVPAWGRVHSTSRRRRFGGTTFRAPFVAVRRTSRPGDSYRAVGSIVSGKGVFAVDNHLIVCRPADGLFRTCKELLDQLKTDATNNWLDRKICCRHLTVSSVRKLPWWGQ